jgi:biotin synthase
MDRLELLDRLKETNPEKLRDLFLQADTVRREMVGNAVHLRGLIEISNRCRRQCLYCGIRAGNLSITRYSMTEPEILQAVEEAVRLGLGTVVIQSGEHPDLDIPWLARIVSRIKSEYSVAVTLSLGERTHSELASLREAGADRYLLRFETSNPKIFRHIHPEFTLGAPGRFQIIHWLHDLGFEVGSGIMIGLPGQSFSDIAEDILTFRELDLDMIGVGPFIPHPSTPLGKTTDPASEVPNDLQMTLKVIALTRIVCPDVNIPSTTALESLTPSQGYESGLSCGANIVMPNLTPRKYRILYEIYPAKACFAQNAEDIISRLKDHLHSMGRHIGTGRGDSIHMKESHEKQKGKKE